MANGSAFQSYAAGVQSVATIIAFIVGGIWTYRVFEQTKQTAAAQEKLANDQFTREKVAAEAEKQRRIESCFIRAGQNAG
jgi:hypothetical protein